MEIFCYIVIILLSILINLMCPCWIKVLISLKKDTDNKLLKGGVYTHFVLNAFIIIIKFICNKFNCLLYIGLSYTVEIKIREQRTSYNFLNLEVTTHPNQHQQS